MEEILVTKAQRKIVHKQSGVNKKIVTNMICRP